MERLTDQQWALVEPHLPKRKASPKGGRPPADDRACFEGILWILRTGARWKDLPKEYPSPAACWRRLAEWEREEVWLDLWRAFIAQLDHQGQLDWSEAFMDGTFAPAKKGGLAWEEHARAKGARHRLHRPAPADPREPLRGGGPLAPERSGAAPTAPVPHRTERLDGDTPDKYRARCQSVAPSPDLDLRGPRARYAGSRTEPSEPRRSEHRRERAQPPPSPAGF